jgi:hypothetical protein
MGQAETVCRAGCHQQQPKSSSQRATAQHFDLELCQGSSSSSSPPFIVTGNPPPVAAEECVWPVCVVPWLTHPPAIYFTPQEAQAARLQTDGYELDRNHHFKVSMFDDFERYARVPDEYAAPEVKQYAPTVSWMLVAHC